MTHILRIDEMSKPKQLGVRRYMNSKKPVIYDFVDDLTPFKYGCVWLYPIASDHRFSKPGFDKIDKQIDYFDKFCTLISKKTGYTYEDFYNAAKEHGYGNCDVFACRDNGTIHYLIPTKTKFAEFPMNKTFKNDDYAMNELEKKLNAIFDKVEQK